MTKAQILQILKILGVFGIIPVWATNMTPGDDSADMKERKRTDNYEYRLITAESDKTFDNQKVLNNLNGQIGLTYDMQAVRSAENGIHGGRWDGRPTTADGRFEIVLSQKGVAEKFSHKKIAYDLEGKDSTVNLEDTNHEGTSWEIVKPKEEWWQKYKAPYTRIFHLRATQGKFKGYYLTFEGPELVKVDEKRSYMRRRAVLSKEPTELSVLLKLEYRER